MKFIRKYFPNAQPFEVLIIGAIVLLLALILMSAFHITAIKHACREYGGEPVTLGRDAEPVCMDLDGATIIPRRKFMPKG